MLYFFSNSKRNIATLYVHSYLYKIDLPVDATTISVNIKTSQGPAAIACCLVTKVNYFSHRRTTSCTAIYNDNFFNSYLRKSLIESPLHLSKVEDILKSNPCIIRCCGENSFVWVNSDNKVLFWQFFSKSLSNYIFPYERWPKMYFSIWADWLL